MVGRYWTARGCALWALAACLAAGGAEKTVTVAAGETVGLEAALAAAGLTLETGDTLVKMGEGRLVGSDAYAALKADLRIVEGVFEGNAPAHFFASGNIAVRSGATLDVRNTSGSDAPLLRGRNLFLKGAGHPSAAVTVNGRTLTGALLIRGQINFQLMDGCAFWLDGEDATIASTASGNNGYLTTAWITSKDGVHTLTLLGPGHTFGADGHPQNGFYQHRFRYGKGFERTDGFARLVVDGAALTAHDVAYTASPRPFPLEVRGGGLFGPGGTRFAACFSTIDFAWGTGVSCEEASAQVTLPSFTGFPSISARVAATVGGAWTARAEDLLQGRRLVAHGHPLAFGPQATLAVDGLAALDGGTVYTLAQADGALVGRPSLALDAEGPQRWATSVGEDGTTLVLACAPPDLPQVVNVRDWGVAPGEDRAEANDAAFAKGLAALAAGEAHILFFPQGRYVFASPVRLARPGAFTLLGDNGFSRLAVAPTAASVLAVSEAASVTVTGLTLAGGAGAAVAADGVASLVVTNNIFADVPGVRAAADAPAAFPVAADDCARVLVRENRVTGGALYAANVLATGATALADGMEPGADGVVLYVPYDAADPYGTTAFADALAGRGLAAYPQGAPLVKKGAGKMAAPASAEVGARLGPVEVAEGTLVCSEAANLGLDVAGKTLSVRDGATLLVESHAVDVVTAKEATFVFSGPGAQKTQAQAALCIRKASWRQTEDCTFRLASDVTFRLVSLGAAVSCGLFSSSSQRPLCTLDQGGHTLTLKGDEGRDKSIYRFRLGCLFRNGGPLVVRNATVSASYGAYRGEDGVRPPLLEIGADARLRVNNQDFADVFACYAFEPGARYAAESEQALATAYVRGAPLLEATVALTITNAYTAVAADLAAGAKMTAEKALAFGPACRADVDGVEQLARTDAGYVLATAQGGVSGRPKPTAALAKAGWTTALSADGKSLLLRRAGGFLLLVR